MRIVKNPKSTADVIVFQASDAPYSIYQMPDNEEDRVRIFVAHAICDPNAPLRTINKELEPEVSADSAVPVAKIVMNDLVLNMRKLSTAANEDHVIRFLRQ